MALDETTSAYLHTVAKSRGKPLHEMTPDEARGARGLLLPLLGKGPEMARVEDVRHERGFSSRLLVPAVAVRGVIVWFHGGGWVLGSAAESDALGRLMAKRTGFAVLLVGYRLAPENRFPVAVDDASAAVDWVQENLARIAGSKPSLIVGGDSAGGNLAAVVSLRARDRQGPPIALQVLVYPVVEANFDRPSYLAPENQLALTREGMMWFWNHYAPDAATRLSPDAAPLRANDLSRLPPAVVVTAEYDVLRDEGEAYAQALIRAGVPVTFKRFENQIHTFFTMVNVLPGAAAGLDFVARAIDAQLPSGDGPTR
jgi:acetyl esterase